MKRLLRELLDSIALVVCAFVIYRGIVFSFDLLSPALRDYALIALGIFAAIFLWLICLLFQSFLSSIRRY